MIGAGWVRLAADPSVSGAASLPTPWVIFISVGTTVVTTLLGVAAYFNTRRGTMGASSKDIAEASAIARKDLVDEVARLAALAERNEQQIAVLTAGRVQDRAECDRQLAEVRQEMDKERAWSSRLVAALRDAGLSVPERGTM